LKSRAGTGVAIFEIWIICQYWSFRIEKWPEGTEKQAKRGFVLCDYLVEIALDYAFLLRELGLV
jgi:hypothetical protein